MCVCVCVCVCVCACVSACVCGNGVVPEPICAVGMGVAALCCAYTEDGKSWCLADYSMTAVSLHCFSLALQELF